MLKFDKVSLSFTTEGRKQEIVKDLTYTFEDGKITALTGASGIGKTTLLDLAAGLIKADSGRVENTYKRTAYVFQEPRLLPWQTALENVVGVCGSEEVAKRYLDILLPGEYDKYPDELSGGMQQRVALARAMAYDAELLLLDEALKGLDEQTKELVVKVLSEHLVGRTAIMVTHDKSDMALCNTVLVADSSPITELKR